MLAGTLRVTVITSLALALLATPVLAADTDGDGLWDSFERRWRVTDYLDPDTDGDGVVDSAEDLDNDRLGNIGEQRFGTDPTKWDSDGDRVSDGKEDADGDGASNAREQDQRRLPQGLRPSLRAAYDDRQPDRVRCQTKHRRQTIRSCTFGDPRSDTTIALVGDSNMTMYLTAYKQIAKARGWKLVTMTKASCPAFLGLHGPLQHKIDKGRSCRAWRRSVLQKLKADPPDYIVFGHASYKLKTVRGRDIPASKWPSLWQAAVKKTLSQLPATSETLVLGVLPKTRKDPVGCLQNHKLDMSRCVTGRVPPRDRAIDKALAKGARIGGGQYATLHDQICSHDPCPLVQGKVLVWRDRVHLTETFARKLRPSVAAMLDETLLGSGR